MANLILTREQLRKTYQNLKIRGKEKVQNAKLNLSKDSTNPKLLLVKVKGNECQHVEKGKCVRCFFTFRSLINVPRTTIIQTEEPNNA